MKQDKINIQTARRCLLYRNINCENKDCVNKSCPLNKYYKTKEEKKWEKIIKKGSDGCIACM